MTCSSLHRYSYVMSHASGSGSGCTSECVSPASSSQLPMNSNSHKLSHSRSHSHIRPHLFPARSYSHTSDNQGRRASFSSGSNSTSCSSGPRVPLYTDTALTSRSYTGSSSGRATSFMTDYFSNLNSTGSIEQQHGPDMCDGGISPTAQAESSTQQPPRQPSRVKRVKTRPEPFPYRFSNIISFPQRLFHPERIAGSAADGIATAVPPHDLEAGTLAAPPRATLDPEKGTAGGEKLAFGSSAGNVSVVDTKFKVGKIRSFEKTPANRIKLRDVLEK